MAGSRLQLLLVEFRSRNEARRTGACHRIGIIPRPPAHAHSGLARALV
jgi:hypothetical protein